MKVRLEIENAKDAEQSLPLHCTFSQRGGLIGSGTDATWRMQDRKGEIPAEVARVVVREGRFALEVLKDVDVYANGARGVLPQGHPIFLSDRDRLQIGELQVLVRVGEILGDGQRVDEIVGGDLGDAAGVLLEGTPVKDSEPITSPPQAVSDPLSAFDPGTSSTDLVDPIEAFTREDSRRMSESDDKLSSSIIVRDDRHDQTENMRPDDDGIDTPIKPRGISRDRYGFEELESPSPLQAEQSDPREGSSVDHVALRRLSRALGLEFGLISQGQAEEVLEEIGASMRAAVYGLNKIYAARAKQAADFPLASMHLHAIEDNPLRFSQSSDEALHALFAKQGAVYLSAPAAISESLEHLDHHQSATEEAVNKALDRVLDALAPKSLEKRFEKYSRGATPQRGQERDAWCWQMYKSYFDELTSHRQRGLKMLFWEIFGYEYQALMRDFEHSRNDEDGLEDTF